MKTIFEQLPNQKTKISWLEMKKKPGIYESTGYIFLVNEYGNVWFLRGDAKLCGPPTNCENSLFTHVGGKITIIDEV